MDESDGGFVEVSERAFQQMRARYVVGVEGDQKLRVDMREAVVEVSGLGVGARSRPRQVLGAELRAHHGNLRAPTIIENPDLERPGVTDSQGPDDRGPKDVHVFVVGGDHHRHPPALERRPRVAYRQPPTREHGHGKGHQGKRLGDHERQRQPEVGSRQGEPPAPDHVSDARHQGHDAREAPRGAVCGNRRKAERGIGRGRRDDRLHGGVLAE